jgi:hypothetical protein
VIGNRVAQVVAATAVAFAVCAAALAADGPVMTLRATPIGTSAATAPLSIELFRWSTDAERAPLLAALAPLPPAPPAAAAPAGGRAGRGGRGGRGAAPPPSPQARLTAAVKAAPSVGFIWGDGVTGFSIKYAWRAEAAGGERIVLVTDRRLGAHSPLWPDVSGPAAGAAAAGTADAEYTVIEMRLDPNGAGEAKASLTTAVVVDAVSKTLALDGYATAPALLKVTR